MKAAFVSAPSAHLFVDKFAWLVEGFSSLGHETRRIHHIDELKSVDAWADLVVFDQYGAGLPPGNSPAAAEGKRAVWCQCWRDLVATDPTKPISKQETYFGYGRVMRAMDLVCVKERARIDEYKAAGINAVYLDAQACPSQMEPCEHRERPECDVLVLGQADRAYADRRADVAALVKAGYKVLWAGLSNTAGPNGVHGHPWVHPLKGLPALASRCACALSVDLRHETGYTSDRLWLLAGCGISVVARVPEMATEEGIGLLPQAQAGAAIYSDTEGLLEHVTRLVANHSDRVRAGSLGREFVMRSHTYRHRATAILQAAFPQ